MQEYVLLLATLGAALRGLPLPKQPDADALAISALAALWGLVCVFESFRAYRGTLIDARVLLLLICGLAVTLGAPRSRFFVVVGYSVVLALWVVLKVPYSWDSEYWQVQTDGDLWCHARRAILTRGVNNQKVRKVLGHTAELDIQEG